MPILIWGIHPHFPGVDINAMRVSTHNKTPAVKQVEVADLEQDRGRGLYSHGCPAALKAAAGVVHEARLAHVGQVAPWDPPQQRHQLAPVAHAQAERVRPGNCSKCKYGNCTRLALSNAAQYLEEQNLNNTTHKYPRDAHELTFCLQTQCIQNLEADPGQQQK